MQIRGIIFDFNGVLVNDEPIHLHAHQQALKEEGLDLGQDEYYERYLPYDDRNFFLNFLTDQGRQTSPERIRRLMDIKSFHYFKAIEKNVPVIQSSVDFVLRLPTEIPLAIASGAAKREIEFILSRLELGKRFVRIVAAEDVANGKPHPEAFLKALDGLKEDEPTLKRDQVIVIEDSYRVIQSVQAAAMKCVALATTYPAERLAEADLVLESLEGWTLSKLEEGLAVRP